MKHWLVTGASGLLGLNFALHFASRIHITGVVNHHPLRHPPFEVVSADLTRPEALERLIEETKPEVVLHTAALANLDVCEQHPELAWRLNAEVPAELARVCAQKGIRLVHISTDAVFDGQRGNYTEEDVPNPLSTYARSKLAAEQYVLQTHPQALVARVNFYGWSLQGRRSLAEFFFYNLSQGHRVNGFVDVIFCPLEVTQLSEILVTLVERDCQGLYHVVSRECLSKYAFGCALAERFGLDAGLITPISVNDSQLRAPRAPNLTLCTAKLQAVVGEVPGQREGLERFYQHYREGRAAYLRAMALDLEHPQA